MIRLLSKFMQLPDSLPVCQNCQLVFKKRREYFTFAAFLSTSSRIVELPIIQHHLLQFKVTSNHSSHLGKC